MGSLTTSDGLELYYQQWPVENAKAAVVLVHGFGEHIGRYEHVAEALNAAGYDVTGVDHRMHGKSGGEPRGYLTDIDKVVDDLKLVWDKVKTENAGKPMFMIGHSMGGLIAACFAVRYQDEMRALVTSGAALVSKDSFPAPLLSMGRFLARFIPNLPTPKISSSQLSHDSNIGLAYDNDPLVYHGALKLGTLAAFAKAGTEALEKAPSLKLPLLILHGEADKVVPNATSKAFYNYAGSQDKTLKIYPNLYHEIYNELEKEEILKTVIEWLDSHLFAANAK